jgi:hypothetical protein
MIPVVFFAILAGVLVSIPLVLAIFKPLVIGKNGYSLSKLQLLLWTLLIATSYVIYLWHLAQAPGSANFNIVLSSNLLLLMGISAGSYVGAQALYAYQDQKGNLPARPTPPRWRNLISDYAGSLDLIDGSSERDYDTSVQRCSRVKSCPAT